MNEHSETLTRAQVFVDRKYVTRADERQKAMGLAYVEAERQDLAREMTRFAQSEALRLSQAEPGYVVKPLEWRTHKGDDFCDVHYDSDAIGGSYTIEARKNGSFDLWKPNAQVERYASLDEAKSAAQADYEQRIRSAITTVGTTEPGYVAGFEAGRNAAADLIRRWRDDAAEFSDERAQLMRNVCQNLMTAIAALPAPATAPEGWRPIETAPTNGTEHAWPYVTVLVVDENGDVTQADYKGEDGWWPANLDSEYGSQIYPTHWMPLPAAPTKRSATDPATAPEGEEVTADDLADFIDGLGILMVTPITDDDECAEVARALLSTYKITKRSAT